MNSWDSIITDRDREVYEAAGYGAPQELGDNPALLIIDVSYNFTGDRPEPILESIKRFRNSCGEAAWEGIAAIRKLIDAARPLGIPIIYSTAEDRKTESQLGRWATKNRRAHEDLGPEGEKRRQIVAEIAPQPGDLVIRKEKPSVFFGTPLASHLVQLGVDSLLVTGTTTSGCVRATVIDAFSYNYRVAVVEEGTFDRGEVSHKVNLFDMNQKYAQVISLEEALAYLEKRKNATLQAGA